MLYKNVSRCVVRPNCQAVHIGPATPEAAMFCCVAAGATVTAVCAVLLHAGCRQRLETGHVLYRSNHCCAGMRLGVAEFGP